MLYKQNHVCTAQLSALRLRRWFFLEETEPSFSPRQLFLMPHIIPSTILCRISSLNKLPDVQPQKLMRGNLYKRYVLALCDLFYKRQRNLLGGKIKDLISRIQQQQQQKW